MTGILSSPNKKDSGRSLRASSKGIELANIALTDKKLRRTDLEAPAECCLATINSFFAGKAIDRVTFVKICGYLELEWQSIIQEEETPRSDTVCSAATVEHWVNFDNPESSMSPESPFYIDRPSIEECCYGVITKPGALIRVKAPRQMGKSSLTNRILDHAEQQGYRTTLLNLRSAGEEALSSLDALLKWLCDRITTKLRLPNKVEEYWQGVSGSLGKCTNYFEFYLLKEINVPLALCLDDVDKVFRHPAIASDFFGLLRSWHEESKINPVWQNLRLMITHSEDVYIPLNINQSPFNVGLPIELPPFNQAQIEDLVKRHGLQWSAMEVDSLMMMVGGHPFLTQMALQKIACGTVTLAEFLQVAPTQAWLLGDHLRRHQRHLEAQNLVNVLRHIVESENPVRLLTGEASKLANMGLIRFQGNDSIISCNLYRQYFREMLGEMQ